MVRSPGNPLFSLLRVVIVWSLIAFLLGSLVETSLASTKRERRTFQRSIVDRQGNLNRKFKKVRRKRTTHIIVHTSEGGLQNTLKVVSEGKHVRGRRRTYGGHAHYVIARDGRTYRTLDKRYRADHAGLSMWNGEKDLSDVSIGIELVGYHHMALTSKQYRSVRILIDILQDIYKLDDRAVLTHSQVAYGQPNRWFAKDHRGRKRCAKNLDRRKAGLGPTWERDPDVKAGRLQPDRELATIYYGPGRGAAREGSNIITSTNTAWMIAGEDYDATTTLYRFPNGRLIPGNRIAKSVGWRRIPGGTEVLLNEAGIPRSEEAESPVGVIANGRTAWSFAGVDYRKKTTLYFFPNGRMKTGQQISDWDGLPPDTRILVGYRGPFKVTSSHPPIKIAGAKYNHKDTLYYFPDRSFVSGAKIEDFERLPRGVRIFLPARSS
ncbi:MAG: N-acetylmuramoyl-L-alanine amidase [Candidatus Krumholzibacteriia bacterium]